MNSSKPEFSSLTQSLYIRANKELNTSPQLIQLLIKSCEHNQILVLNTGFNIQIGYIAWLRVSKETLIMSHNRGQLPQYSYEWHEGHLMLIYDTVFLHKWHKLARDQALEFLRQQRFIATYRRQRINIIRNPQRLRRFIGRSILGEKS